MTHVIGPMAVCVLLAVAPGAMSAEPAAPTINKACAPDLKQFCPNVSPGGGRIAECLRENFERLSPACKEAIKTARANKK